MSHSLSDKLIKNTMFNAIGQFWGIAVAICLTPYIVKHIGVERYGIWSIAGVFTSYFGLLDFGIRTAFVKYIAEYYVKKDLEKINQVISTGFIFYIFFAAAMLLASFFLVEPLFNIFSIPKYLYQESRFVFLVGIVLFGLTSAFSAVASVQSGLQRMEISNILSMVISIPNIAGTIFFIENGFGLRGLMVNNALMLCLSGTASYLIAFRLLPGFRLSPSMFTKSMFKKLFSYGYKLQISSLANVVSFQSDRVMITYFLGVGLVAFYQLGVSVLQGVRQVCLLLISSITPAASEIDASGRGTALPALYIRVSKYLVFVSAFLSVFAAINAGLILLAWMGPGYEKSVLVVQILAVGYFAATVTGVASAIAAGVAKTELDMKFGIFLTVLDLALGIVMIIKLGFLGVVAASSISLLIASIYYIRLFHRYLKIPVLQFAGLCYKPLMAVVFPGLVMYLANHYFWLDKNYGARLYYLAVLAAHGLFFAGLYCAQILYVRYFEEQDYLLLKVRFPGFFSICKIA